MARLEDAHGAAHFKLKVTFSSFSSLLVSFTFSTKPCNPYGPYLGHVIIPNLQIILL
jgi:hypothetical protein